MIKNKCKIENRETLTHRLLPSSNTNAKLNYILFSSCLSRGLEADTLKDLARRRCAGGVRSPSSCGGSSIALLALKPCTHHSMPRPVGQPHPCSAYPKLAKLVAKPCTGFGKITENTVLLYTILVKIVYKFKFFFSCSTFKHKNVKLVLPNPIQHEIHFKKDTNVNRKVVEMSKVVQSGKLWC